MVQVCKPVFTDRYHFLYLGYALERVLKIIPAICRKVGRMGGVNEFSNTL